jgi:hypothetical protein
MRAMELCSIPGVVHVEVLRGPRAARGAPPDLLVEVPHGADERDHYDALHAQLHSPLPARLHGFFHANTDIGAWAYGRRAASRLVEARPETSALVVRCLVPRTFVDTNRELATADDLARGGLTAAMPPYVTDARDQALLNRLHGDYVGVIEAAYEQTCGAGGLALSPHTYGPYVLPIAKIDDTIVTQLEAAHAPGTIETLPVRPEIDLLADTKEGECLADPALVLDVQRRLEDVGYSVARSRTYQLLPGSQTHRLSRRYPGRVLCLEVRRDLLVRQYTALTEMEVDPAEVERLAAPLAAALLRSLAAR